MLGPDGSVVPVRGSVGPQVDVAETTRVVEFNDIAGLEARPGRRRRRRRPVRAGPDQRRDRPAGTRLPRRRPRDHAADRHAPDHRRDPHDLRRTGRRDGRLGPRAGPRRHRQDDRWRDPVGGLRLQPGGRRARRRFDRGRGFRCRRDRRHAGRLRPVAGRDTGDARRGPDRRRLRPDDPARRTLGGRRERGPRAMPASRGT